MEGISECLENLKLVIVPRWKFSYKRLDNLLVNGTDTTPSSVHFPSISRAPVPLFLSFKMKFTAIITACLLTGFAAAAPGTAMRKARAEARADRKTLPPQSLEAAAAAGHQGTNNTNVEYDSNWAGSIVTTSGVKSVTGTFTVPTPSSAGSGSAWVGIDGDSCQTAILQTGIDWTKSGSSITYDAWYEWYPDYAYDFSGITIAAGDSITVTVVASGTTG